MVRDTCASGDCALLLLLCNPSFAAPVSSSDELRWAVVSFAWGKHREQCYTAYTLVGDRNNMHYEVNLDQVLRPGFWVVSVFYIWASLAYGCNIQSHFFNEFREPKVETSGDLSRNTSQRILMKLNVQWTSSFISIRIWLSASLTWTTTMQHLFQVNPHLVNWF
jgi:hypothetical protein